MARTNTETYIVNERTAAQYTATIKDQTGTAIPAASMTALTLTLEDVGSGTILNSRTAQNILNANNVTVSAGGVMVWTMQPADNAIVSTTAAHGSTETHRATFKVSYGSGLTAYIVRDFRVVALDRAS